MKVKKIQKTWSIYFEKYLISCHIHHQTILTIPKFSFRKLWSCALPFWRWKAQSTRQTLGSKPWAQAAEQWVPRCVPKKKKMMWVPYALW